ncbi:MAG: 2-oxoglutarate dehydrogenase complex dihydrolipoyllysine-residue succinyltransferase [Sorangiineae bacterium]|nr:2-oxoglutarate dehydrogenase complex dihydrolipoyllysine-residue succinyltransferase [Polyangiaceae bacterium]MEB2322454.1 2-oxoglutarate dehydrogenase complex dihydrolipoyllysine-residue succinyltransferase [Sorangiineae bacterium]
MSIELKVPEVGESITEVQIGDWLKQVGDRVAQDEPVVTIETDKVTVELPAPVSGVISEIRAAKGAVASVGDVIGLMTEGAGASAGAPAPRPAVAAGPPAPAATAPAKRTAPPAAPPQPSSPANEPPPKSSVSASAIPPEGYARVMPSARRVLAERGLDAAEVTATGPGGRVLKEDALRAEARPAAPAREPRPAPSPPPGARVEEVVPMSPMRKRIAERLVESQQTAALLTTFNEIDMTAVMALRKQHQPLFQERYGIKLGMMSFFVKAAIEGLKLVPQVNAEIRGTDIVYRNYYDIGVAVGGGRGLVVPVLRSAERLGFAEIELAIQDFGARARDNKLRLDELSGGTFTITNGGIYGNLLSTPIINPPQSAILGMHAIQERPVARDGQVVIRPMMYVAVTYDHRIIDGREAVTFLKRIKECVETPERILLEV